MTPIQSTYRCARGPAFAGLALLLSISGCTMLPWQMPPEDRSLQQPPQQTPALASANRSGKQATGSANVIADKPLSDDYYRVKPGDTLYRIATSHGQRSEDIVKWNNLTNPGHIGAGGVLRVTPPPDTSKSKESPAASAETQANAKTPAKHDVDNVTHKDDKTADAARSHFGWPAHGTLSAVYGQGKSKGMVISARSGDPVRAAAPGRVVFAGDGGKPYGKLIVIRHDDMLVTAYGHNRKLLVKEGANVKRGDVIAEMAGTEHGDGAMQFEVRKEGKPVDPALYLPRVGT
ncbi:M23 family metallopeptidase [Paraburkholderia sp. C35]|uniref:M23 family metallopeptidase n=1 Tax=Paraburkholderia sp. C35 TaxID=2126993 RepID=UPI000D691C78|nr:M23 family metallopeptidase [Paraburkholderia sp. C35]